MGLLSIIRKQKIKEKEIRVLVLGLDNSGKTTISKKLLHEDVTSVAPTFGFQIHTINYEGFTLNMWDIGGQVSLRSFWGNYFDQTNAIIWVIDSLGLERLPESFGELKDKIITQDRLVGMYLLILVNKVDLLNNEQRQQVLEKVINLWQSCGQLANPDRYDVKLVSGVSGCGIQNVLNWLISREY